MEVIPFTIIFLFNAVLMCRHASCSDRRRFGLTDGTASLRVCLTRSLSLTEGSLWGMRSASLWWQGLPPQPLVELGQQGGNNRVPCAGWLHNRLDLNSIDVRIQVLDQATARCSSIECFWYSNGGISTGAVVWPITIWGHHEDKATAIHGLPVGTGPNLRVAVTWIWIKSRCRWRWARCPDQGSKDGCHDRDTLNDLGGADVTAYTGHPILSWIHLMLIMKPKPGALVPALGVASSSLCLPRWQRSTTRRWAECCRETWCQMSLVPWSSRRDLECFLLPGVPLSMSCHQIFVMWIGRNATMQDQSQRRYGEI
jgi:hypothetical protein